jgi:hypothetical protein
LFDDEDILDLCEALEFIIMTSAPVRQAVVAEDGGLWCFASTLVEVRGKDVDDVHSVAVGDGWLSLRQKILKDQLFVNNWVAVSEDYERVAQYVSQLVSLRRVLGTSASWASHGGDNILQRLLLALAQAVRKYRCACLLLRSVLLKITVDRFDEMSDSSWRSWTDEDHRFWRFYRVRLDSLMNWNGSGVDPREIRVCRRDGLFLFMKGCSIDPLCSDIYIGSGDE